MVLEGSFCWPPLHTLENRWRHVLGTSCDCVTKACGSAVRHSRHQMFRYYQLQLFRQKLQCWHMHQNSF